MVPGNAMHHSSVESNKSKQRAASKSPDPLFEPETETLKRQLHSAQEEIASLRQQLSEVEGTSDKYLDEVRGLLRDREPKLEQLMEVTLRKERIEQEKKDAIVL